MVSHVRIDPLTTYDSEATVSGRHDTESRLTLFKDTDTPQAGDSTALSLQSF